MIQDDFVGMWNLVTTEFNWPNGERADLFGPDALGMLIYGRQGQMSVQIMRARRPVFAAGDFRRGAEAEIKAAFEGYLAYFGTYSIDEGEHSVSHHIRGSLFPNWAGQDLKRFYELAGNRLILHTPPTLAPAIAAVASAGVTAANQQFSGFLVWERAGA